ncbi:DUF2829 domain-containing protein [Vibrio parahaemolyticus]|nr:DUF2829 domain-containing protein [Vibrio parahaemolyticus]EGR3062207.1 DUF2829 domain-containing protein [Vibrio parahaemolyticus]EGR3071853.1 DUF2829 domain-containing protein [Vibrio parahaemolyticus]EGR3171327.1 DUF2829 domain-containing protein [Vibrio parahaemolyticus]
MKTYIGTKIILAVAMSRQQYNDYRGWTLPDNENGDDEGFLVEYLDGGQANHPDHKGYISWSPKEVFENAYKPSGNMNFGQALEMMKLGKKVARSGWNGKGMWLILVPGTASVRPVAGTPYSNAGITSETDINPHIDMYTADGKMQPGWLASQTDMLADDWCVCE